MLIHTRYLNSGWTVDENTANLIPEIRAVLKDEKLGVNAVAFVALAQDPTSFLFQVYSEEDARAKQAFITVYEAESKFETLIKNKKVIVALSRYAELCDTMGMRFRKQFRDGVEAVGKFVEDNSSKINPTNFDKYVSSVQKMPALMTQLNEMDKGDKDELEIVKKVIRGDRALSYRESKIQSKKK